jgi:NAD+ diphosphatase
MVPCAAHADALMKSGTVSFAWFLVHRKGVVVRRDDDRVTLPTDEDAASLGADLDAAHELGFLGDARALGVAVDDGARFEAPFEVRPLRDLYFALDEDRAAMAGRATQIVEWAMTSRFCGRCATTTERVAGERCTRCPACGLLAYPRIAPAVIVLVTRGDEALLARGARFPMPFYSALAGFAEPGESLEETLAREVREEVGIEVTEPRYFGSQPWPFPHSLMVGFFAQWAGGEIRPDGREILDAQWFRPDALPMVPPRISIARRLIDAWVKDAPRVPL